MDLLEYKGKQVLGRHGVRQLPGEAVSTVDDAVAASDEIGFPIVIKAQVKIGGRGKAGGIKIAADADELRAYAGTPSTRSGCSGRRRSPASCTPPSSSTARRRRRS
jgi:succinyl-CoA synthetase beta subunit